jgi:hypothetical protein
MHAPDDNATPSRSGLRRLISPWESRHLRAVASVRFAAGGFTLSVGLVLVSLGRQAETRPERRKCYGWATCFLVNAALQFTGGLVATALERSAPPEPPR